MGGGGGGGVVNGEKGMFSQKCHQNQSEFDGKTPSGAALRARITVDINTPKEHKKRR